MTAWVVLLRGVNVGPHRRVAMPALREALAGAGEVRTYVQSGNVVLRGPASAAAAGRLVHDALAGLGVEADAVVRSGAELADLVRRNPWPERTDEPTRLNVGFLSAAGEGVAKRVGPHEEVRFDGSEVWLWYGDGQARTRLALDVGDRVLTVRNWRTVVALAELSA